MPVHLDHWPKRTPLFGALWRLGCRCGPQWLARGFAVAGMSMERARQRRALARLDDRLLRDIGVTREEVEHETGRPVRRP